VRALAWERHAACGEPVLPGGARVGQGDRGAYGGEVRQDDRFLKSGRAGVCGRTTTWSGSIASTVNEEKARYKWRKRRTTVRFLVLLLDRYYGGKSARFATAGKKKTSRRPGPFSPKTSGFTIELRDGSHSSGSARSVLYSQPVPLSDRPHSAIA